MTSNYQDIYSRFLGRIRDYDFLNLSEPDASSQMREWLQDAISEPYIYSMFSSVVCDDEIATIEYELKNSIDEYSDKNLVEKVLACQMVVEFLNPKVVNTSTLNQMISNSKETKFYSQSSHLQELRALLEESKAEARKLLRDKSYVHNSYLG